jgi:general secretion pathway protein G
MFNKIRKASHSEKGFTLVEMMVVLIIIAVLIGLGINVYIKYIGTAKMTKASGDITTVQAAIEGYYATKNAYPFGAASADLQTTLTNAGISPDEVDATGVTTDTTPYVYTCTVADGPYEVYMRKAVNEKYMEGSGTGGVSSQAALVATP